MGLINIMTSCGPRCSMHLFKEANSFLIAYSSLFIIYNSFGMTYADFNEKSKCKLRCAGLFLISFSLRNIFEQDERREQFLLLFFSKHPLFAFSFILYRNIMLYIGEFPDCF